MEEDYITRKYVNTNWIKKKINTRLRRGWSSFFKNELSFNWNTTTAFCIKNESIYNNSSNRDDNIKITREKQSQLFEFILIDLFLSHW
jgi:hypothetical protein